MSETKDRVFVGAIKKEIVPIVWPVVLPMLEAPIEHSNGELCIQDMFDRICNGELLLLTIQENEKVVAAVTIEKREFASGKSILNVTTAGGSDMHLWMKLLDTTLNRLAKDYDCEEIYIVGRPGWERMLKNIGYGKVHTVVSKKVEV